MKDEDSAQMLPADHFLSPLPVPQTLSLSHTTQLPFSPFVSESHAPSAVTSVLIHLLLLISSSAGKCFGG